ncbi:unnamed protein product [Acanthocheilonema viteae]|uniref:Uncharacterized protein n=1 Tax=Acanthocheilonema viteae TaxID=6277 RepID=A0A498SEV5_ACAVI|nr:unnamed protein product [Acanthocheilonema viteae]
MQQENSSKCSEVTALKRELEELQRNAASRSKMHTELAKLQVSVRNLQLQEELLRQDNAEMQKQLKICEEEKLATKTDFESLQSMHSALLMDHDGLQKLHDMLSADYDRVKYDNTLLNIKLKNHKGTAEEVLNERRQFEELKLAIAEERERRDREVRIMRNDMMTLRNNYEQIRKDNISLARNAQLNKDELRKLRFVEQNQRTISERLTAQIDDLQQKLQARNLEITELLQKIELFTHLNKTLEEESLILNRQVNHLMAQNQELLTKTSNNKDITYHNAQKDFQEKLSSLRSDKEELQGKINEQYHILDNKKGTAKEKPTFLEGTAKALISKSSGSHKFSMNDCVSNGVFSTENYVNDASTGESSAYPAEESLTATAAKRNLSLKTSTNGQLPMKYYNRRYCSIPDDQPCSSSDELTFINKSCELQQNGQQVNAESRNDSMHCSRTFMRNIFRAEYSSLRSTVPFNERSIDIISLSGSERGIDVPSSIHTLPPRPPSRSNSTGRSSRNRLPPPTYQPKNSIKQSTAIVISNKPPPPPYKGRVTAPTKQTIEFSPKETSTPKSEHNGSEDEKRNIIRDKMERNEKTISIYENVDNNDASLGSEIGTIWYEYGCV